MIKFEIERQNDRRNTLDMIDQLITSNCHSCESRIFRGAFSHADKHCNKVCPIGSELQRLGFQLNDQIKSMRSERKYFSKARC